MLNDRVCEGLEVCPEDLPRVLGEDCVSLAQGEYGRDCVSRDWVSFGFNTKPLQPDVQLRQQLELVYQIIVFIELTGSISPTLSIPHYRVVHFIITV